MKQLCSALFLIFTVNICFAASQRIISLWHKEESTQSRRTLEELCVIFGQEYSIEFQITRFDPTDIAPVLIKNSMEQTLPEIAFVPADLLGLNEELGLSEIPPSHIDNGIKPKFQETAVVDGKVFGAPILGGNHLLLYYNKRYVDQPAETWEQMFEQHKTFADRGIRTVGFHYNEPFWLMGFINALGGEIRSESATKLATEPVQKALIFYKSLSDSGLVDKHCDYSCAARRFYNGEFAYAINGDWAYSDAENALGKDFGVAVLPMLNERHIRPMFSTTALVFPNHSLEGENRDVLLALIRFMQSDDVQEHWYRAADRFPVNEAIFDKFSATADENRRQALLQLEYSDMMPNDRDMAIAWQGLRKGLNRFLSGTADVSNVTQIMQKYIRHQKNKAQQKSK